MDIYIDIIVIENIIMNCIIILTTSIICKTKPNIIRLLIASIIGAIYAALFYILDSTIFFNEIFKIIVAISMNFIAFNTKKIKLLLQYTLIFFLISFCFGGASYYLLNTNILFKKYKIYAIVFGGIIGFMLTCISFNILKKKITKNDLIYDIEIYYGDKKRKIKTLLDTGNFLKDPITNTPVVIIEEKELVGIIPENILKNSRNFVNYQVEGLGQEILSRCNIIPYSSIGNKSGILLGFRPDFIIININEEEIKRRAIIGIYNEKISKSNKYFGLIGLNLIN